MNEIEVAEVISITGTAFAVNAAGETRKLEPGSMLLDGETVQTSEGGQVELRLLDGSPFIIDNAEFLVSVDLLAEMAASREESEVSLETIDGVLAAIEEGEGDLLDGLEATAAGDDSSGEGSSFVMLDRIGDQNEAGDVAAQAGIADAQEDPFSGVDPDPDPVNTEPVAVADSFSALEDSVLVGDLSSNDEPSGEGGNVYAVVDSGGPSHGTLTLQDDGNFEYTPDADFVGTDSFTYSITDPSGDVVSAEVVINITGVEDVPISLPDSFEVLEDTLLEGLDVLANDKDADGDPLTIISAVSANDGKVTINEDGTLDYQSATNFNGLDEITYTIDDGNGNTATATVTINVIPVNDAPELVPDTFNAIEDTLLEQMSVLGNDTDAEGDALTVVDVQSSQGATVSINEDGTLNYLGAANFNGVDTLTYTVSDGVGGTSTSTVTVNVAPANDPPELSVEDLTAGEDGAVATGSATFTDIDLDTPVFSVSSMAPDQGSVSIDAASGEYTFDPGSDFQDLANGEQMTVSFQVTASDQKGATVTETVNVVVTGGNDAASITSVVSDGTSGTVSVDDPDTGESLLISVEADMGTVTIDANGNWNYTQDDSLAAIQALPDGATITDTITFTSVDGTTETQIVTITGANDPASIVVSLTDSTLSEDADSAASGQVTVSDIDTGESGIPSATASLGEVTVDDDGHWVYTLDNSDAEVQALPEGVTITDTIVFTSTDGTTQTQIVTLTGANDVASIVVTPIDTTLTEDSDNIASGQVAVSDVDSGEESAPSATADLGVVTVDSSGNWTYVLNNSVAAVQALASGQTMTDTLVFTSADGTTQTQTITITGANDAASITVAATDTVVTEDDGANNTATGSVSVTDADTGEGTLDTAVATFGTVTVEGSGSWEYSLNNSDSAVQALPEGTTLTDSIVFTSDDGSTQTQIITITGANDAASITVTAADTVVTEDDSADNTAAGTVLVTDVDTGEGALDTAVASFGTVTVDGAGNWIYNLDNSAAEVQALPEGATLNDTIVFTTDDGTTQTQTVLITGANDTQNINVTVTDTAVTEDDTGNSTAAGAVSVTDSDAGEGTIASALASYGTVTVDGDGNWVYTLDNSDPAVQALPAGSTLTDTILFTSDGGATQTQTIVLTGTDDASAITVTPGTTAEVTVTEDDGSNNTAVGTVSVTDIDTGEGRLETAVANYGTVTVDGEGNWSYVLNNGAAEVQALGEGVTMTDSIVFTAEDGTTQTQSISITGANDAANILVSASDLSVSEDGDSQASGSISVSDVDAGEGTLGATSASYGTVTVDGSGSWSYLLNNSDSAVQALPEGATLTDTIVFTSDDGTTQTQVVTITGANDAASIIVTAADTEVTEDDGADSTASGTVAVTDVDTGEGTLDTAVASFGTVTVDASGNWTYLLNNSDATVQALPNGETISDTIVFTADDGTTQTQIVTITGANDPVVAVDDLATTNEDTPLSSSVDLDGNDTDLDGDSLSVIAGTLVTAQGGSLVLASDGSYTYTPAADFNGTDSVDYTVTDGTATDIGTLTITVNAVNDPPVAVDDAASTDEDTLLTGAIELDANDTDLDGDSLSVTAGTFATAQGGSLVLASDGSYTYTPAADFNGTDTVTYTVTDGSAVDTGVLTITVNAVNDAPLLTGDMSATVVSSATYTLTSSDLGSTDTDDADGDVTFTCTSIVNGKMQVNGVDADTFTAAQIAAGVVTFVHDGSDTSVASFEVSVDDGDEDVSAPARGTFEFVVTTNLSSADDELTVSEDSINNPGNVSDNDSTSSGGALTYALASGVSHGTLILAGDGSYTYTPVANFDGTDSFSYTVTDSVGGETATQTVTITVDPVNDPPIAVDDATSTNEDTPLTGSVELDANDTDLDGDSLSVTAGTFATAQGGSLVLASDGSYTYTPAADFSGTDTVDYTVTDGTASDTGTLTITVNPVNDAVVAVDDTTALDGTEDTTSGTLNTALLSNDVDVDGDTLTITEINGTALTGGVQSIAVTNGTVNVDASDNITFTPATNYNGAVSFSYTVSDGVLTDTATVSGTIGAANDAPVAVDDIASSSEDLVLTSSIDLTENDTDLDGDSLSVTAGTFATTQGGSLVLAASSTATGASFTALTLIVSVPVSVKAPSVTV